jgi:hypothetical protein
MRAVQEQEVRESAILVILVAMDKAKESADEGFCLLD